MCLAVRDENERAGLKRISMAFDNRLPASAFDVKPLIRAFMPVVFPAFAFARLYDHRSDLGAIISGQDVKPFRVFYSRMFHCVRAGSAWLQLPIKINAAL
jgi:hypothetical protein